MNKGKQCAALQLSTKGCECFQSWPGRRSGDTGINESKVEASPRKFAVSSEVVDKESTAIVMWTDCL